MNKLRKALTKHVNINLDTPEGKLILQNWFITQSAPDNSKVLEKLALGPSAKLGELLTIASLVFYNQNKEEEERSGKKKKRRKKT